MTSPTSRSPVLQQILVVSPEGRQEALWAEETGNNGEYRILSVPIWAYGLSIGTIVFAEAQDPGFRTFQRVVKPSRGSTVRFVAVEGLEAGALYLSRVVPDARRMNLNVGPATFFNPRLVAMNIHRREDWWPNVGGYLETLVVEGIVETWEVADPDEYREVDEPIAERVGQVLRHPLPTDSRADIAILRLN